MNINTLARQFVEKKALIDRLSKELDAIKAQIFEYHNGRDLIFESGVESKIIYGTRSTIQKDEIEKLLGYAVPESCYKYTNYKQLKVKLVA